MGQLFHTYLETHNLKALLAPPSERIPFPSAADRSAWASLSKAHKDEITAEYQRLRTTPYPMLTATQFLAFTRSGSRIAYETPYFLRRKKLICAALYECIRHDGEALDDIVDGVWCLCEESFWGVSAHNGSAHPGARPAEEHPLPDTDNPYIDLFAAQTAATLALICFLLEDELNAVTPSLRRRVRAETERRILAPFLIRDDFWWMGMMPKPVNNWNPWILSNLMLTLLVWEKDDTRLAEGLVKALRVLDAYLDSLPEDGGCDEGVAYWNMAGGSLLDCLETLLCATGGRADFYKDPLIRAIGMFPVHAQIDGAYFWNFADCDAKPLLDGERVYCYGVRTDCAELAALGVDIAHRHPDALGRDTPEFSRILNRLFHPAPSPESWLPHCKPQTALLPALQVMAMRNGKLYTAIKAGHNDESHNHNDVGSFILYKDGEPKVVDAGNAIYTARTFGPERYTLWHTRSANHNVPIIDGYEQAAGRGYAARNVRFRKQCADMDISGAYPAAAGLRTLRRRMTCQGESFILSDEIILDSARCVTWVFLLRGAPVLSLGQADIPGLRITYNPALDTGITEIRVDDPRMRRSFPGSLYRMTLVSHAAAAFTERFIFTPVQADTAKAIYE